MSSAIACDIEGFDLDVCEKDPQYFKDGVERYKEHKKTAEDMDRKSVNRGKQLKMAREYLGYSQSDLCSKIDGLSQSNLSKFEHGFVGTINDEILHDIMQFLDWPFGWLDVECPGNYSTIKLYIMKKESKSDKKVHKVMSEYKEGTLKSSSGKKVRSRKQAIAIAMSVSGKNKKK